MRYLSRFFMVLSALCFAMPAFAQGGGMERKAVGSLSLPDSRWPSRPRSAELAQGEGGRLGYRITRPKSCCATWNPVRAHSWLGPDRVAGSVYPGDHLPEGKVRLVSLAI